MHRRTRVAVAATIAALSLLPAVSADAGRPDPHGDRPVTRWASRHAEPVTDRSLARAVGDATVVGLGEPAHRLSEITQLKLRTVRHLVEEQGFGSVAWEEDWTLGRRIDAYVLGRRDDLRRLVGQMSSTAWRTREVADVLRWMRRHNDAVARPGDRVRFVGVEYFATRPLAYRAVLRYVAREAPHRLPAARRHVRAIVPPNDDMGAYLQWFLEEVDDKAAYVAHARALHRLVGRVGHPAGDRAHSLARHHARQIRSFYEALTRRHNYAFRDARAAASVRWWQRHSGDRVVYWAASPHTAVVPRVWLDYPPYPAVTFRSTGSHLRRWYGEDYRSIGYTYDRGVADDEAGNRVRVAPALSHWFEAPFSDVDRPVFVLDLRRPAPPRVRRWLDRPMLTRGYPEARRHSTFGGGTAGDWFDVVVHRQRISPAKQIDGG